MAPVALAHGGRHACTAAAGYRGIPALKPLHAQSPARSAAGCRAAEGVALAIATFLMASATRRRAAPRRAGRRAVGGKAPAGGGELDEEERRVQLLHGRSPGEACCTSAARACSSSRRPQQAPQSWGCRGGLAKRAFDPIGIRPAGEVARCMLSDMGVPRHARARVRHARIIGRSAAAGMMRYTAEALQLEADVVEELGLEPVLDSGDIPKIVADVSKDLYSDIVAGKVGLADLCGDVVSDVLSDLAAPF